MDIHPILLHECKPKYIFRGPSGVYQNNYFKDNTFILSEKVLFPRVILILFALLTVSLPSFNWCRVLSSPHPAGILSYQVKICSFHLKREQ